MLNVGDVVSVKQSVIDKKEWTSDLAARGEVLEVRNDEVYLFPVIVRWFWDGRIIIAGFQTDELEVQS